MISHTRALLELILEIYPHCSAEGQDIISLELRRVFKGTDVGKHLKK